MYIKSKNNFPHGIMFHHFHDLKKHYKGQGSINKYDLLKLIKFLGRKNIINADEFYLKYKNNTLKKNELCITFDDGLKCQIDVAVPVLEKLKIKAFFFINTCNFSNKPLMLEVFRFFRLTYYKNVDKFYEDFYLNLDVDEIIVEKFLKTKSKIAKHWAIKFPFYSYGDIKFRILREFFLTENSYNQTMLKMFKRKNFNFKKKLPEIYMNKKDIKKLVKLNHVVGLHSHTHPTIMRTLPIRIQKKEYSINKKLLQQITNKEIFSVGHPCGSYSSQTLKILKNLKIDFGFRSTTVIDMNMKKINNSNYEIARMDHTNIISTMKNL
jgi:peptidoglycan/xylan/chitin deacetylase (PgdA/CDA1 family)